MASASYRVLGLAVLVLMLIVVTSEAATPTAPKWPLAFSGEFDTYESDENNGKPSGSAIVSHYEDGNVGRLYRVDLTSTVGVSFALTIADSKKGIVYSLTRPAGKDACFTPQPIGKDLKTSNVYVELMYEVELGLINSRPTFKRLTSKAGRIVYEWEIPVAQHEGQVLTYFEDVFERIPVGLANSAGRALVLSRYSSRPPSQASFNVDAVLCTQGTGKLPSPTGGDPAYPKYFKASVSQSFQRGNRVDYKKEIYHNNDFIMNTAGEPVRAKLRTDIKAQDEQAQLSIYLDQNVTYSTKITAGACADHLVSYESVPVVPLASELKGAKFLGYVVIRNHFCNHWNLTNKSPDEDIEYYEDYFTRLPVSLKSTKAGKTYSNYQYIKVETYDAPGLSQSLFQVPYGAPCSVQPALTPSIPSEWTGDFRGPDGGQRVWYFDYSNARQRFDIPHGETETHVAIAQRELTQNDPPTNEFAQYEISSNPDSPCHIARPVPNPLLPLSFDGTLNGLVAVGDHLCRHWVIPAADGGNTTMDLYEDAFTRDLVRLDGLIALQPTIEFTMFDRTSLAANIDIFNVPKFFECSSDNCQYATCRQCLDAHSVCHWCQNDGGHCAVRSDSVTTLEMSMLEAADVVLLGMGKSGDDKCTLPTSDPADCPAEVCPDFKNCTQCMSSGVCGWCRKQTDTGDAGCVPLKAQSDQPISDQCPDDEQTWFPRTCPTECPLSCSGHGKCNARIGKCSCDGAYGGTGCEIPLNAGVNELLINATSISGICVLVFCILGIAIWYHHKHGAGSRGLAPSPRKTGNGSREYEELNSYPSTPDEDGGVGVDIESTDIADAETPVRGTELA